MKRIAAALLVLMMLLAACTALAEKVVFEDLQYGEAAFQLHLKDETNTITFKDEVYSLKAGPTPTAARPARCMK